MRILLLLLASLLAPIVHAQDDPYAPSRAIIEDLSRIVAPTGVQDSYKTSIGGVAQWLNVRGQDRANPMILFVHGGPASPITPTMWQFQRPIEEYFTVANWDQRASGKSYGETAPEKVADTIRIERYVDDAIEVAEHLKARYKQRKLILVGHSWGTVVGMLAALKRPDLFHAYVGIGQVLNVRENERISFEYAYERAKRENNGEAVKEMASIAPYPGDQPITRERIIIARKWPQHYGGLTAYRSESGYFFRGPLLSPEYTPQQVKDIDKGNVLTLARVLPAFLDVDFSSVKRFPIPVVMFLGRHDYTTPAAPTVAWMEKVDAPYKRVVWFERSAHMVPWEEPGKLLVSLIEVVRPLAK
ncbi:alpha/beta hydrolase [Massilia sp. G4R7]|uniref:Alpha/beta hydrolase n=1 Tax=Massilia phyllostachyos TaxID=2898585 RepID=A0ABS8Q1A9_9BURK|nr:alpha/beta hydrolase [Massilia phyllostachyos]MCD2514771.1 alpha/beta hydrolase [Massilia phyllostachyos]